LGGPNCGAKILEKKYEFLPARRLSRHTNGFQISCNSMLLTKEHAYAPAIPYLRYYKHINVIL
jgi:hypothetical protein